MKKTIVSILGVLCIMLMLCSGCMKVDEGSYESTPPHTPATEANTTANTVETTTAYVEPTGVPDTIILRNVSIPENATYEIAHNYDPVSHIDDAVLTIYDKKTFGTEITTYSYAYQYDRSSDLWDLLDESKVKELCSVSFDKDAYINNSPFTGRVKEYHDCKYSISILDINLETMSAQIKYSVKFSSDSVQNLNSTSTVELWYADNGSGPYFIIPYRRSIVVRDSMYFMLTIDGGIQFVR